MLNLLKTEIELNNDVAGREQASPETSHRTLLAATVPCEKMDREALCHKVQAPG
ncbi:MAG: hypothetical protein LDL19_01915 [Thiobacillus sp.]|nr:hypothetical protein [Thiobacillus sp.]